MLLLRHVGGKTGQRRISALLYVRDGDNTTPNRPTTPKGVSFVSIEVGLTMYHPVDEKMDVFLDELAFGKARVGCNP